ncbi:p450 domain containing protein, partial [Asbolus verrucosus]
MKYMDMVVSETLRLWPAAVAANRVCTRPYIIEPKTPDEKPLYLKKDTVIFLPIYAIHRDAQYFPDPERFDPERF